MIRKTRTKDLVIMPKKKKQQNNKKLRYNVLFLIAAISAAAAGAVLGPGIQPVLADAPDAATEDILENLRVG